MNHTLLAAAALTVSACSFAPEYRRPDVALPEDYRFTGQTQAASIADLPWWEVFKDPVLQALIREAVANNLDLALAMARVEEARSLAGVARADLYPQLNGQGTATYGQQVPKQLVPDAKQTGSFSLSATLTWELDLWGRVRNANAAARADLLATEYGRHGVVLSLVASVAQAYLELRELDLELEIARSNTSARRETLSIFETRARGGIASDLEVTQARSNLQVTTAAISSTGLAIAVKEHQLSVLLGRPPGPIPRGVSLVDTPVIPQLPAGIPAQLLTRRPDLLASEQAIVAAGKRVGVAVANRLPIVSLTGLIGLASTQLHGVSAADALVWNGGAGFLAPLFDGGRLKSEEDVARARLQQAVIQYQGSVQVALQEVADAAAGTRYLSSVRAALAEQVRATTLGARLALARYQGGASGYLEVLDAQRQVFDAELNLARSERDELTSMVQLYRALGGGWQQQEAPRPPPGELPGRPGPRTAAGGGQDLR